MPIRFASRSRIQHPRLDIMMDRRRFVRLAGAGVAMVALDTRAQRAVRLPRIGVLLTGNLAGTTFDTMREGFRELGYVEGRTAVIEWRTWESKPERLQEVVAELMGLNLDVIVVGGSEATKALKEATRTIPIVFSGPSYPVEEGLVASFARPGGNLTGVTLAQPDHVAKLLQVLRDVVPALADVGVVWSPINPGSTFLFRDTEAAARALKFKVLSVPIASGADVEPAVAAITRARPGALILNPSAITNANADRIVELAIRLRIPTITQAKALMERGLLMSYGADIRELQRRIPSYVDRILKGAKPADMPVERPTKFELAINMKTAKAIGIAIPNSLLLRADEVIQ
jgi:putative tryptophan/tyrosine transport system substrate-binding protein